MTKYYAAILDEEGNPVGSPLPLSDENLEEMQFIMDALADGKGIYSYV